MFKKIICLCISFAMIFSLVACSKDDGDTSSDEWEYDYETVINKVEKDKDNVEDGKGGNSASGGKSSSTQKSSDSPKNAHIGGELTVAGAGTDPLADYKVKGNVIVAIDTARLNDYQGIFDSFKKVYPNVKLKFDYFAHTTTDSAEEYLSTRAAAGNMPDIVYDDAGPLPTYLTQGWMHSLDKFVKNDTDYQKYVPNNLKQDYTYGGKLYALPHQAHYETFMLNTDLWNKLNIKDEKTGKVLSQPSLSWTLNDFEKYCKAAVGPNTAAQEDLSALYLSFINNFNSNTTASGYNMKTKQFETSGVSKSIKFLMNLKSVPGLEAASLKPTGGSTGNNNYFTKFGTGSYSDGWVAFHKGLTLFHGLGTWEYATMKKTVTNFKWKMFPFPQSSPGVMPFHVDICWMTTSCRNEDAAWQLLRYCTYSFEGNVARLSMYDKENKGKYALVNELYYPTCNHPKIVKKFKSLPNVTDVQMYLYENQSKCYRYDMNKLVPEWTTIYNTYLRDALGTAKSGTVSNVDSTITEAYKKANVAVKDAWNKLNSKLK